MLEGNGSKKGQNIDPQRAAMLKKWWEIVGRLKIFPETWKTALVCPLYKKGRRDEPYNYRPVRIISHARKLVDAAIIKFLSD